MDCFISSIKKIPYFVKKKINGKEIFSEWFFGRLVVIENGIRDKKEV